jgi:hypothetical protein
LIHVVKMTVLWFKVRFFGTFGPWALQAVEFWAYFGRHIGYNFGNNLSIRPIQIKTVNTNFKQAYVFEQAYVFKQAFVISKTHTHTSMLRNAAWS